MRIHWQIWFLLSFVICASWSLYQSMSSYGRGEALAEQNWNYAVEKAEVKSLAEFCKKNNILPNEKEEANSDIAIFNTETNPLYCSGSLASAKKSYGLWSQKQAKAQSIRFTFGFMGVWLGILITLFIVGRIVNRQKRSKD